VTSASNASQDFRIEEDALGDVKVPIDHLWGAQTERSHENFPIGVGRYRWGRPVIRALGVLQSVQLLAEAVQSFNNRCALGIEPNAARIREHLDNSLMLVTALNPHIGYEKAARISLKAYREGLSLRDAALQLGYITAEQFDEWVRPADMTHPLEVHRDGAAA
jgi:fumarate hydratase class II